MGLLQTIIDKQIAFQERLAADPELPGTKGTTMFERLQFFADAIILEGAETKEWLNWKRHRRNYGQDPDERTQYEIAIEAIDILHYDINLLVELGYDTEEKVLELYTRKNDENHQRQDNKY